MEKPQVNSSKLKLPFWKYFHYSVPTVWHSRKDRIMGAEKASWVVVSRVMINISRWSMDGFKYRDNSVWCNNSRHTSSYTHINPRNFQHQEWNLMQLYILDDSDVSIQVLLMILIVAWGAAITTTRRNDNLSPFPQLWVKIPVVVYRKLTTMGT